MPWISNLFAGKNADCNDLFWLINKALSEWFKIHIQNHNYSCTNLINTHAYERIVVFSQIQEQVITLLYYVPYKVTVIA